MKKLIKCSSKNLIIVIFLLCGFSILKGQDTFPGTALEFDGVDDYVQVDSIVIPASGNFTISVWVKVDILPIGHVEILSQNAGSGEDFYIGKAINGNIRAGDDWGDTGVPFPTDGEWHYFTLVKESLNTHLYLDGFHKASNNNSIVNPAGSEFRIARQYGPHAEYFYGMVEELRIWNVSRTIEEIRENMHLTLSGNEPGLVSYWQLNEAAGDTIYDPILGNNGIMYNMDTMDWINSSVPVGGGESFSHIVNTTGIFDFSGVGFTMDFTSKTDTDTIVASRLDLAPNLLPQFAQIDTFNNQYWIVNKYGTGIFNANLTFSVSEDLFVDDEQNPHQIKLFDRPDNSAGIWSNPTSANFVNSTLNNAQFDSISDFSQFILGRVKDPEYIYLYPADDSYEIFGNIDFELIFNRNVYAGGGFINIYNSSDSSFVESIPAVNTVINDSSVIIDPAIILDYNSNYFVQIDDSAFYDYHHQAFPGIHDIETWNFTTLSRLTELNIGIDEIEKGDIAWGDYDNDNDLDMLVCGNTASGAVTKIYNNDISSGTFTDINAGLDATWQGSAKWGDYDNDGDLDILLTGYIGSNNYITKVYRNDSTSTTGREFTDINAGLDGIYIGEADWGDYDNDGDLDIALTGYSNNGTITKIYRNDPSANTGAIFTDINAGLPGAYLSSIEWFDYDNDGWIDLMVCGNAGSTLISNIYRNESLPSGERIFTNINAGILGTINGASAIGDYDNDGDSDVLLIGDISNGRIAKIYENDSGIFTDINAGLTGLNSGDVQWFDYDNDGDLDILLSGSINSFTNITALYINNSGSFSQSAIDLIDVSNSVISCADYDNDNDLDILFSGYDGSTNVLQMFRNNCFSSNHLPSIPDGLISTQIGDSIIFNWNEATDEETPQDGLSYNLIIGNSDYNILMNSPMADKNTGYRRISHSGLVKQPTSWIYVTPEIYFKPQVMQSNYWGVQAIDASFAGSHFAILTNARTPNLEYLQLINKNVIGLMDSLSWEATLIDSIVSYNIQIDDDSTFNSIEIFDTLYVSEDSSAYSLNNNYLSLQLNALNDIDSLVDDLKYFWRIKPNYIFGLPTVYSDTASNFILEGPNSIGELQNGLIPFRFELKQNYPNPFNPITKIEYALPKTTNVKIELFDVTGRKIKTLIEDVKEAGYHRFEFNGSNLASGTYLYRIQAGNFLSAKKMLLLK